MVGPTCHTLSFPSSSLSCGSNCARHAQRRVAVGGGWQRNTRRRRPELGGERQRTRLGGSVFRICHIFTPRQYRTLSFLDRYRSALNTNRCPRETSHRDFHFHRSSQLHPLSLRRSPRRIRQSRSDVPSGQVFRPQRCHPPLAHPSRHRPNTQR